MKIWYFFLVLFTVFSIPVQGVKIDRVILGCDTNPMYLEFWPIVAKTWKEMVGIKPTLAFIAPKDFPIDESLGDVIRIEPLAGIPTAFQAQAIRLLLPAYFENEVCIISDMDMIPCQKDYFVNSVKDLPEDAFIVYKDAAIDTRQYKEYPMCYNVALGKTYKEVFNITDIAAIPAIMREWYALGLGWTSDQQILYAMVNDWNNKTHRLIKLGHDVYPRVDRLYWGYNEILLQRKNYYLDCHMLRPYSAYKSHIDKVVNSLFIDIK